MFDIATVKLAVSLGRLATSIISGNSTHRDKVAADLDSIAGAAREIAERLQENPEADIAELTGRMQHFAGQIRRTLHDIVSEKAASETGLLTSTDVDSFAEKLQHAVEQLLAFDGTNDGSRVKEHKDIVRELKLVAGQLAAQSDEIRGSATSPSIGAWRSVKPVLATIGTGAAAGWAVLQAASTVSLENVKDNYIVARSTLASLVGWKIQSPEEEQDSDTA